MRRDASWYGGSPPAVWEMKRPEVYNVPDPGPDPESPASPSFLPPQDVVGTFFIGRYWSPHVRGTTN